MHALRLTPVLRQTVAVLISYRRRYFECFSYHCFKNGDWLRTALVLSCMLVVLLQTCYAGDIANTLSVGNFQLY